jgi:hypothetical protein
MSKVTKIHMTTSKGVVPDGAMGIRVILENRYVDVVVTDPDSGNLSTRELGPALMMLGEKLMENDTEAIG